MLIADICALCRVSRQWLNKLVDCGKVPGIRRAANGRLEILDEQAALSGWSRQRHHRTRKRIGLKMDAGLAHLIRDPASAIQDRYLRFTEMHTAINKRNRELAGNLMRENLHTAGFASSREWSRRARTMGGRFARAFCWSWVMEGKEDVLPTAIVIFKRSPAFTEGIMRLQGGKVWDLRVPKFITLASIARTFGLSKQALYKAWKLYCVEHNQPYLKGPYYGGDIPKHSKKNRRNIFQEDVDSLESDDGDELSY